MRLTTRGRFAVTAMLDLALNSNQGPVSLASISQRQTISLSYLEQLFSKLKRSQLISSIRGPGGGYLLGHAEEHISVADIITAVDEPLDATRCGGHRNCHDDKPCMTHELWASLNDCMMSYLCSISLCDLVRMQQSPPGKVLSVIQKPDPHREVQI